MQRCHLSMQHSFFVVMWSCSRWLIILCLRISSTSNCRCSSVRLKPLSHMQNSRTTPSLTGWLRLFSSDSAPIVKILEIRIFEFFADSCEMTPSRLQPNSNPTSSRIQAEFKPNLSRILAKSKPASSQLQTDSCLPRVHLVVRGLKGVSCASDVTSFWLLILIVHP